MMVQTETEQELREFIVDNFLYGDEGSGLSGDESLLERGIIDSTGILELVLFLEEKYGIDIHDKELVPANLDSLHNMVRFVDSKIHRSGVAKA